MYSFRTLKADARSSLVGNWGIAVGVGLLAALLGGGGMSFSANFGTDTSSTQELEQNQEVKELIAEWMPVLLTFLVIMVAAAVVYSLLVASVIRVGYARFNLDLVGVGFPAVGTLFSGFRKWSNIVATNMLQTVIVFGKLLLFVIPGIIAVYDYAMVPYLLADNPSQSARQALRTSKAMMRGHRFELFCLDLSFFGWVLLSVLTLGVGFIWLNPYMEATHACFYLSLDQTVTFKTQE